MVNEKMIRFRIKPYLEEATLQLILDTIIWLMLLIILVVVKIPTVICVLSAIGYLVFMLVAFYRVVIQALIDRRNEDFVTAEVVIENFTEEFSFAGNRLGHSNIRFFYPKEMQVKKYKIKTTDLQGKEMTIRSVMSFRRLMQFSVLEHQQITQFKITYLKKSKILVNIDLIEEVSGKTSKRKQEMINKTIRYLNSAV